ncbi:MAG: NTP transferase domain-containing protein [Bacteroidales bacterium]
MNISVLILAAGFSKRMGLHKFALKLKNGSTFLENLAHQFHDFGCRRIVVVVQQEASVIIENLKLHFPYNVEFVINYHPEYGRFSSIKAGIVALESEDLVFIQNVDNPLLNPETLKLLINGLGDFNYAFPVYKGRGGHPVLITKQVMNGFIKSQKADINLKDFLRQFRGNPINVDDETVLLNINTTEDYMKLISDEGEL